MDNNIVVANLTLYVSPSRKTKVDKLTYVRLKEKMSSICEVAVWGKEVPKEGVLHISNFKSSKMSELSTTRASEIKIRCESRNIA